MLKVLKGTKQEVPDHLQMYLRNLCNAANALESDPEDRTHLKKLVFNGVRVMNLIAESQEPAQTHYDGIKSVMADIGRLTPAELITIFPVDKIFDGDKYRLKDYFFTMNILRETGMDKQIGVDNVMELLWDYVNRDIRKLMVNLMEALDDIRRSQVGIGVFEEWAADVGLPIYYRFRDGSTNKEYVQNSQTGKITRVTKAKPRHFKLLK